MAADYKLPLTISKRVRFFDGQFLQDQDFVDEQKYHLSWQNRHHRLLHVSGVVEGLTVYPPANSTLQVKIRSGMAIDADGRQILLADYSLPIELQSESGADTFWVYIAYHQEAVDEPASEKGVKEFTRWQDTPYYFAHAGNQPLGIDDKDFGSPDWNGYLNEAEGPPPPVLLAKVTVGAANSLNIDETVRRFSGMRLPGPNSAAPTLRTDPNGSVGLWLVHKNDEVKRLTVLASGELGIGTSTPMQTLDVNGRVNISNGVIQRGGDPVTDTSDLGLYSRNEGQGIRIVTNNAPITFFTDGGSTGNGSGSQAKLQILNDGTVDIAGKKNIAGQISLQLKSGNNANNFNSNQITLGYDNGSSFRHALKTRHNGSSQLGNAIDFYVWKYLSAEDKDEPGDIGTLHTMTLNGGRVGIGTTNPSTTLDVEGTIRANYLWIDPQNSSGEGGELRLDGSGGAKNIILDNYFGNLRIFNLADDKYLHVLGATSINGNLGIGQAPGTEKLAVTGTTSISGNVGIGQAPGTEKLAVTGTTKISGNVGIGQAPGTEPLEVAGAIRAASGLYMDTKSTTAQSSAGWHRIIEGVTDSGRESGIFEIRWGVSGRHGHVRFAVAAEYGDDSGAQLTLLDKSNYGGAIVSKIRLLMKGDSDQHYVEFYFNGSIHDNYAITFNIYQLSGYGWSLVDPKAGSIPSGYTDHEILSDTLFATRTGASGSNFLVDNQQIKTGTLTVGAWPADSEYVFFGTNNLNQSNSSNYALLQASTTSGSVGRTYLNSPVDIRFRINNIDKMILANDGAFRVNGSLQFGGTDWYLDTTSWKDGNIRYNGSADTATFGIHGQGSGKKVNVFIDGDLDAPNIIQTEEKLRTIRGTVEADGTIVVGSGFTVTKSYTGTYDISFSSNFSGRPTVVVSQQYPDDNTTSGGKISDRGGDTRDNAVVVGVTSSMVRIKTGESDGDATDRRFHFIAIGPK